MIVDANVLLHSVAEGSPHHEAASSWLTAALRGDRRVGLPWQSIGAFVRIATNPRATLEPLSSEQAWGRVEAWLAADPVWVPPATERTAAVLGGLLRRYHLTGNLVADAQLAALAVEHGLTVVSGDSDFARFAELRWLNPLT